MYQSVTLTLAFKTTINTVQPPISVPECESDVSFLNHLQHRVSSYQLSDQLRPIRTSRVIFISGSQKSDRRLRGISQSTATGQKTGEFRTQPLKSVMVPVMIAAAYPISLFSINSTSFSSQFCHHINVLVDCTVSSFLHSSQSSSKKVVCAALICIIQTLTCDLMTCFTNSLSVAGQGVMYLNNRVRVATAAVVHQPCSVYPSTLAKTRPP